MSVFSKKLTNLREAKNWSKTYVAKQLGLSSMQTYANWEYGRTEPDFSNVSKLADLFGVTTDYLLGRPEKSHHVSDEDLEIALDRAHSFSGKPLSDHDRKVAKDVLRSLFQD